MSRNLEKQMRLSLRAILAKRIHDKKVLISFISDDNGFPLSGLRRTSTDSVIDMDPEEYEELSAKIPQMWEQLCTMNESINTAMGSNKNNKQEISHLVIGLKEKGKNTPELELMIAKTDDFYLSSIYYLKKE